MSDTEHHEGVKAAGGLDGDQLADNVRDQLDYLSTLCKQLHVPDPVEQYLSPVVGKWSALHEEADRWRAAAKVASKVTTDVKQPLGGIDAAWQGKDAEAFLHYMSTFGLAGSDMAEAMTAMGTALDKLADGIRSIVTQMTEVLSNSADDASNAMSMPVKSEQQVRDYLDDLHRPTSELYESVRQALEAFVKLCDNVHGESAFGGVRMDHSMPATGLALPSYQSPAQTFHAPAPQPGPSGESSPSSVDSGGDASGGSGGRSVGAAAGGGSTGGDAAVGGGSVGGGAVGGSPDGPQPPGAFSGASETPSGQGQAAAASTAAAAAGSGGQGQGQGGVGGVPMMPMGAMGGAGRGGDQEYKSKRSLAGDVNEIFGAPERTAPSVIGADDEPPREPKK